MSPDLSVRTLRVNGEPWEADADVRSVADLLRRLGRDPAAVAVEYNGEIVRRAQWDGVELSEGDRLEIVQFVQGG